MLTARVHASQASSQVPLKSGPGLHKLRKRLENQMAKIQKSRTTMEERRRRQLWRIATVLDEIARQETDFKLDSEEIQVEFADPAADATDAATDDVGELKLD